MTEAEISARVEESLSMRAKMKGTLLGAITPQLVSCDAGKFLYRFQTADWMRNPVNTLHGGLSAAMLDTAMGVTASVLSGNIPVTISMTQNYVRPVLLTGELYITVRPQHCGQTVAYLTAEMWQKSDQILVTASGAFFVMGIPSPSTGSAETADIS